MEAATRARKNRKRRGLLTIKNARMPQKRRRFSTTPSRTPLKNPSARETRKDGRPSVSGNQGGRLQDAPQPPRRSAEGPERTLCLAVPDSGHAARHAPRKKNKGLSATLCPTKAFSEYLVETILASVEGHNVVMLHSDQEPVLVQLLRAVQSRRVKRTLVRHGLRASHQSQGKIDNANRVINGVCRAMWLSLENLLQEKLPSDSILIAWLIRHAAWSLTRFQVKNDGRTAFVRVFWESMHESSIAIRRKSDVQVHGRADRQSGSEMEPWYLGGQGANDRRTHHFQ